MKLLIFLKVLTQVVQFVLEQPSIVVLFMRSFGPSVDGMPIVAQESSLPIIPVSFVVADQHVVIASTFIFITLIASAMG